MDDRTEHAVQRRLLETLTDSPDRPEAGLQSVVDSICQSGVADHAQLFVVDPDQIHLRLAAMAAADPSSIESLTRALAQTAVRIDGSISGRAATSATPLVLNDLNPADLSIPPNFLAHIQAYDVRHLVGVRVPGAGPLGSLLASRLGDSPAFCDADVALLGRIARLASLALERVELRRRVARQADILDRVADAVIAVDETQTVTKWNQGAERIYGISRADALGQRLSSLITTVSHVHDELEDAWTSLASAGHWREAVRQATRDGRIVEVEASVTPLQDSESGFAGAVAVNRDVSAALRAQRTLVERQAFAEALLDALGGRTLVIRVDGRVHAVNARYEKEGPFGDGPGSGPDVGADAVAYLNLLAPGTPGIGALCAAVRSTLAGDQSRHVFDVPGRDETWTAAEVQPFLGPGGGALVSFSDVSDRKGRELELARRATHDSLTGLPNRALMLDRLRESLGRAHRRGQSIAVLFVDLDGLKQVNDTVGHDAGDDMICAAAERLARCCRVADTVARLGGDEFVVLLDEIADAAEADALALRMLTSLRTPGTPAGGRYVGSLSASIGVALADGLPAPTEDDARDLVGHADAAMLVAKKSGKDQVVLIARPLQSGRRTEPQPTDG